MNIEEIIEERLPESDSLEYKDKRADNNSVVEELVAFANNTGGCLILGVREEDDSIVELQHVENIGERKEGIQNVIAASVEPRIQISFVGDKVEGKQLLGMEVENDGRIHSINVNQKPLFPYRQGSRKDYLHGWELPKLLNRHSPVESSIQKPPTEDGSEWDYDFSVSNNWVGGVSRSGSLGDIAPESPPAYSSPRNRLLCEVAEHTLVIPGKTGIEPFNLDTLTYELKARVAITTDEELGCLAKCAEEFLGANLTRDFYYAIHYNNRQIVGRSIENLLQDSSRINALAARMYPRSGGPSDSRPVGVATVPISGGLLWIQVQWKDGSLRPTRTKCGVLLPEIPFDQSSLEEFFESVGGEPSSYSQKSRIQHLHLNANHDLVRPEAALLKTNSDDVYTEIIADNPLYQQPDSFAESFDTEIPTRFCDAISSINRLPFDVAGGWIAGDKAFSFTDMDVIAIDTMFPTYVVDPMSLSNSDEGS